MAIAHPTKPMPGEEASSATGGQFGGPSGSLPSGGPAGGSWLGIGEMRLAIGDGVLMVFGPEGDPVPPLAFGLAAAGQPDALLVLPDGTKASASRVAAVLRAQILGRLGGPDSASGWILAMLREDGGPDPAAADELRAEQDAADATGPLAAS